MKYISTAKKTEYSNVNEPVYSSEIMPKSIEEFDAIKSEFATNSIKKKSSMDLFAIAKSESLEFEDVSKKIVDIVVKYPISKDEFKLITQKNVEVVCLTTMPGIVFKNPITNEAINVYKGIVKMFVPKV